MTENQLRYLQYQESVRHNLAGEQDTDEALAHKISNDAVVNAETSRSNQAREAETERSNRAETERKAAYDTGQLHEQHRANTLNTATKVFSSALKGATDLVDAFIPG